MRLRLDFPYHYRFESAPFGATVSLLDRDAPVRAIGVTPITYSAETPITDRVRFEYDGYLPAEILPGQGIWNRHFVDLERLEGSVVQAPDVELKSGPSRTWIDALALGTAAVGGVLAVHYKFKADGLYEEYRQTGDPALRAQIERYDLYAGLSLGAMQVGVGVFVVRLVLR